MRVVSLVYQSQSAAKVMKGTIKKVKLDSQDKLLTFHRLNKIQQQIIEKAIQMKVVN